MNRNNFTSESVTCGHPDKICDQIADRILDALLEQDPQSRVACEVTCTTDAVHIFGEVTTKAEVDYAGLARRVIEEIGYTEPNRGFDAETCRIKVDLHEQSPDIARGIARRNEAERINTGAGDQGILFGYACKETVNRMPLPIELAHALAKRLELVRRSNELQYLLPDGKTQVTVEYDGQDRPCRVAAVIVSSQHREGVDIHTLRDDILGHVILPTIPSALIDKDTQFFINPTGRFVMGGPAADSGLTGRKIIVDTYGGYAATAAVPSAAGPSKVDRSAAYAARWVAKNVVAAGLATKCEVELAYAIGVAKPVSIMVDTFGTGTVADEKIVQAVEKVFDLTPAAIIRDLDLRKPIYRQLAAYGHMGREDLGVKWENTDRAEALKAAIAE